VYIKHVLATAMLKTTDLAETESIIEHAEANP